MCAAVESRSVDGIGAEIESAKTRNHLAADGSFLCAYAEPEEMQEDRCACIEDNRQSRKSGLCINGGG